MSHITLVTGGCRSGKSAYAESLATQHAGPRAYIATCPVLDEEMRQRIARHQANRAGQGWLTFEETLDLPAALLRARDFPTVLVDCLTLWINNLLWDAEQRKREVTEDAIAQHSTAVLQAARQHGGRIIVVTNEVGLGIVPENALARRYRDLVGRCNQTIAAGADAVTLVCCGIPLHLKGT